MIEYVPRHYQADFLNFMSQGGLRAFLVWHRRAGKNLTGFQWLISEALLKVGLYYYVFPSLKQAKKILWEGKTGDETEGQKFIDFIHPDWIWPNPRDGVNHSDMTVKLRNPQNRMKEGSMIQLVGTQSSGGKNEADHLRGTNPRGMILDEYSEQNPVVWETIFSPILKENKGWAVFTMTPKGPNHAFKMYNQIRHNPRWYVSVLDITQTYKANGEHIVTLQDIEEEREEGKDEAYIQQEYFCSWAGVQKGSYYTHQIDMLYKDKRVVPGLYRPELDCITTWDIGHDDEMVVMVGQPHGAYTYWIDGFKIAQRDLKWAWGELQQWRQFKGYRYAAHYFPWDMGVHEWGASQGRLQSAQKLGMTNIHIAPKMGVDEGRDAVRRDFQNWWFDERVSWAVGDLGMYSASWDEKTGTFTDKDEKSTQKHTADAFRTYAISERVPSHDLIAQLPTQCDMMIDPMERYGRPTNQTRNDRGMYHHDMGRVTDRYGFLYQGQVIPRTS